MNVLKIIGIIAGIVLIPGGTFIAISAYALTKICYKITDLVVFGISNKTVSLELKMKVKNPSALAVEIGGYEFSVGINGTEVAKITNSQKKKLESKATSLLVIPISIDLDKVFGVAKSAQLLLMFLTRDLGKIVVSLDGKFKGTVGGFPIHSSVSEKMTVDEIKKLAAEPSMPCDIK